MYKKFLQIFLIFAFLLASGLPASAQESQTAEELQKAEETPKKEEAPKAGSTSEKTRDLIYEEEKPLNAEELDALSQKAAKLYEEEKYPEAKEAYEKYVAGAIALVGEKNEIVLDNMLTLGNVYSRLGEYKKAVETLDKALSNIFDLVAPNKLAPNHLMSIIALAESQYKSGDPDEALETLEAGIPLLQKLAQKEKRLGTLIRIGERLQAEIYTEKGEFDKAETLYKKILQAQVKDPGLKSPYTASTAFMLAEVYKATYRRAEALKLYLTIMNNLKGNKDDTSKAISREVRNSLAGLLVNMGNYAEAKAVLEPLIPDFSKADGPHSHNALAARGNLAVAYVHLGEYSKALELQKYVAEARKNTQGEEAPETLIALLNMTGTLKEMGDYGKALEIAESVLRTRLKTLPEDDPSVVVTRDSLAKILSDLGEYDKALEMHAKNVALLEKYGDKRAEELSYNLNGMAAIYSNRPDDDFAKATECSSRALEIQEKLLGKEHPRTLLTRSNYIRGLHNQAERNKDIEGLKKAKALYDEVTPLLEKVYGKEHPNVLYTITSVGVLYRNIGDPAKSCEVLESILPDARASGDLRLAFEITDNLRKAYELSKNLEMATFFGKQTVATGQNLRNSLKSSSVDTQKAFAKEMTPAYQGLADVLVAQNRIAEAQQVMSLLKSDELEDITRASGKEKESKETAKKEEPAPAADLFAGVDADVAKRYQEISDKLVTLGKEQRALLDKRKSGEELTKAEEERLKKLRQDMTAARKVFSTFVGNLSNELSKGQDKRAADLGNLETYQRLLGTMGEGTVLLQTILTDNRLWIILTTPNALLAKESPLDVKTLADKVRTFRDVLQDPEQDARPLAKEFYDAIVGPVAESLKQAEAKTIMFSLDGMLRYIPMGTLYDGKKWLVQEYALSLFNDATKASLAVPPTGNWKVAGLGVTEGHDFNQDGLRGKFSPLPAVKDELKSIVKTQSNPEGVLPGYMVFDEDFTTDTLMEVLETGYPVIHLASHFHFNPKNPENSFLLLGDGSGLDLKRIETEDFQFKSVDLIALSACQTARGGVDATGKEIEGFGALAQKRGAKAVLATLWPVFDESTGLLMANFYRLHADAEKKLSIAESLREAQLLMIDNKVEGKNFQHPFYWGPFVLMGDWR